MCKRSTALKAERQKICLHAASQIRTKQRVFWKGVKQETVPVTGGEAHTCVSYEVRTSSTYKQ
jgi:hypothetical protein